MVAQLRLRNALPIWWQVARPWFVGEGTNRLCQPQDWSVRYHNTSSALPVYATLIDWLIVGVQVTPSSRPCAMWVSVWALLSCTP